MANTEIRAEGDTIVIPDVTKNDSNPTANSLATEESVIPVEDKDDKIRPYSLIFAIAIVLAVVLAFSG